MKEFFHFLSFPSLSKVCNIYGRDITEQKQHESEMRKLSLVADKTTNAVIMTDENGLVEWVNAAFKNLQVIHWMK